MLGENASLLAAIGRAVSGDVHCIDEGCYIVDGHCLRTHPCRDERAATVRETRYPGRKVRKSMSRIFHKSLACSKSFSLLRYVKVTTIP